MRLQLCREHTPNAPESIAARATTRIARIKSEVQSFIELTEINSEVLRVVTPARLEHVWLYREPLRIRMSGVKGWAGTGERWELRSQHQFVIIFPREYPDEPFQISCDRSGPPLFHPNVHARGDGAYCVSVFGETATPRSWSLVDAVLRLEAQVQWRAFTAGAREALDTRARALFEDASNAAMRNLQYSVIRKPQ